MSIHSETRKYEVVVVGGGLAGVCAAIAAARKGARTAIIQNRSMFGGNASSEIRMHIVGCEFPYKSRVMPTSEPLKTLKALYMARNTMKWGFFRLKSQ